MSDVGYAQNENAEAREGKLKAASLYYLAKFIEWPKTEALQKSEPLTVCILGESSLNLYVSDILAKKRVAEREIVVFVNTVTSALEVAKKCHLVYFGRNVEAGTDKVLSHLIGRPILTVSGDQDITEEGGMVYLFRRDNKLKIKIDLPATRNSFLKVSSELLQIAELKQ